MLTLLKKQIKRILPEWLVLFYHSCNAICANSWYGFPSKKLIVIGITGTKGKTSTSEFAWSVLTYGGNHKTGLIGTAHVYIGTQEFPNTFHMTMPNPWYVQKMLRKMIQQNCTHVVLEVSSEGLKQFRHLGIEYDIVVFTNLSPEHLPSHNNSYEEYRRTKSRLFEYTASLPNKKMFNTKIGIFNTDDREVQHFDCFPLREKKYYSLLNLEKDNKVDVNTNTIIIYNTQIQVKIPGRFNIENALAAYTIGIACGISIENIKKGIEHLTYIPGRMEEVVLGQKFRVFIDYAHEKLSMRSLLETLQRIKNPSGKIIILFGAEGGGRDTNKRKEMGLLANTMADMVILSNVDPYDDNPKDIIADIARYVLSDTKVVDSNVFLIEDREAGINKAFSLATEGDIVAICGKGAEKTMIIGGKTIPWDEQKIVRKILEKYI
jgi:UDP-N-acetylmuramoyl-L-alanyl-D-glutamate--2,6-diaminopimelate ligase